MRNAKSKIYFLYILECADGSLYTGIALDIEARLAVHGKGRGSKYVAARLPFRCVYKEGPFAKKGDALRRENEIKKMKRSEKLELVSAYH